MYSYSNGKSILTISGNTLHHDGNFGIYLYSRETYANLSQFIVKGNTVYSITNVSGAGIYCYAYASEMAAEVNGNVVYDNAGKGIYFYVYGSNYHLYPEVVNNQVYRNGGDGIRFHWGSGSLMKPVVTLNQIYENTGYGIYCRAPQAADILYNDVHTNTGGGVYIFAGNGSNVNFNNLNNSGGAYELYNDNASSVNSRFNWWGPAATAQMEAGAIPRTSAASTIFMMT